MVEEQQSSRRHRPSSRASCLKNRPTPFGMLGHVTETSFTRQTCTVRRQAIFLATPSPWTAKLSAQCPPFVPILTISIIPWVSSVCIAAFACRRVPPTTPLILNGIVPVAALHSCGPLLSIVLSRRRHLPMKCIFVLVALPA